MFYYKHKTEKAYLAFKRPLTTNNYPEYSKELISQYVQIDEEEFFKLQEENK